MSDFKNFNNLLNDDSGPFGRQRSRGFRLLKFESDLESQYIQSNFSEFENTRKFALLTLALSLCGWLLWDVWQANRENFPQNSSYIFAIRTFMIATSISCLWMVWKSNSLKFTTLAILTNLGVASLGTVLILILYSKTEQYPTVPILMDGITLMTIAFLFPLGLNFRVSLLTAVIHIALSILIVYLCLDDSHKNVVAALIPFQTTSFLALLGLRYFQEYSNRQKFLFHGSLWQLAGTDSLSGLNTRRVFEHYSNKSMLQASRLSKTCSLLLIDIDNFKKYNDTYGHPMGDMAIKRVSDLMRKNAKRPLDCVGRLGGEEFAIFLYDADVFYAEKLAASLIQSLPEKLKIEFSSNQEGYMTISVGISTSQLGESYEALYQRADIALYKAKNSGRSRYMVSETSVLSECQSS